MTTYLEKTRYRDKTEYVYDETNNKHYTAEYQKSHVNVIKKKKERKQTSKKPCKCN